MPVAQPVCVGEVDAEERRFDRALLCGPGLAAVVCGQDHAELAHRPPALGRRKIYVVEEDVTGLHDVGGLLG